MSPFAIRTPNAADRQSTVYKHEGRTMKRRTLLCAGSTRHAHAASLPVLMQQADTILFF